MFFLTRIAQILGLRQSNNDTTLQAQPQQSSKAEMIAGRRHRVDASYLLPKDESEIDRLDFQHFALRNVLGADYAAPIAPTISTILDVGCGTGRWVLEMAKAYPQAHIAGLDIEIPTFKTPPPAQCQFYEGNVLQGLPFADQTFAYVHQRLLVGAIPASKWPFVIQELVRVTQAGGWVELLESGDRYPHSGPAQKQLMQWWNAGIAQAGFDLSLIPQLDHLCANAGLKNIQMRTIQMPLGKWAGRAGEMMSIDIYNVCRSFKGFYTAKLGVAADAFDAVVNALPEEWEAYRTTYEFYQVYGQK